MPVRSLTSSVLRWPSRETVEREVRRWAAAIAERRPDLVRLALFGSYARGNAGVGSDLDILAVIRSGDDRRERRLSGWDTTSLPVPVDLLVYTEEEWDVLRSQGRFAETLERESVSLYARAPEGRTRAPSPRVPRRGR